MPQTSVISRKELGRPTLKNIAPVTYLTVLNSQHGSMFFIDTKETNDIANLLFIVLSPTTGIVCDFQSSMKLSSLNNSEPITVVSNTICLIIYNSVVYLVTFDHL